MAGKINVKTQSSKDPKHKFWAFISYSHADEAWASWLHKSLEKYRVPKGLVHHQGRHGEIPKRIFPVFRDRDELSGAASLTDKIENALEQSRFLLVICTPHSAVSRYVNEEIKMFKRLGREDRIICIIIDGELTETQAEPVAADARKGKDGKQNALLKILAGMLGVGYDELKQRQKQRQLVQHLQLSAVTIAVLLVIFAVWWSQGQVIDKKNQIAVAGNLAVMAEDIINDRTDISGPGVPLAIESMQRLIKLQQPFTAEDRVLRLGLATLPRRPIIVGGQVGEASRPMEA